MKIKSVIFCLLFLSMPISLMSQETFDYECATPDDNTSDLQGVHSYSTDPQYFTTAPPIVLNVVFWKVNSPTGEYTGVLTENDALATVARLNIVFNEFNIFLKYRGFNSFNSPSNVVIKRWEDLDGDGNYNCETYPGNDPDGFMIVDRCQRYDLWNYASNNGYEDPTALNIYIPYSTTGFGNAAYSIGSNRTIVQLNSLDQTGLFHEVGHNLGLAHTRSSGEHTTREPFLPGGTTPNPDFNATTSGDRVVDTAANSGFRLCDANGQNCYPYITATCEYDGDEEDEIFVPYEIFHKDVINALSNAYECTENSFTPGQAIRMREKIATNSNLTPLVTDVASLYEPYEGEYYFSGPIPPVRKPLFQPGFDYRFVECQGPYAQPSDYNDISFSSNNNNILLAKNKTETDYGSITHPNHSAILIKHEIGNVFYPQARKCYDNYNKAASDGSVTRFNDNVFNTNVTITPKDSTAINNQNLIQDLPNGLYKIEKNYDDGATNETVILKGNN